FAVANLPPHRVQRLFVGAPSSPPRGSLVLPMDEMEPLRGATFRRLGYELLELHRSQGPLLPMDQLLQAELVLMPVPLDPGPLPTSLLGGLRALFDVGCWPEAAAGRDALQRELAGLAQHLGSRSDLQANAVRLLRQ